MKFKKMIFAVATLAFLACTAAIGYKYWWLTRPSARNFDVAIKRILAKKSRLTIGNIYENSPDDLCVNVPQKYISGARHQGGKALVWHADVLKDSLYGNDSDFQKLEALTKVGLLTKANDTLDVNSEIKPVFRYKLTNKGWAAAGYGNNSRCIHYGKRTYWGITSFSLLGETNTNGNEVYTVNALFGVAATPSLAGWARDSKIQSAYPEIVKNLRGKEVSFPLVKGKDGWSEFAPIPILRGATSDERIIPLELKKEIDEQAALPPPTVQEIKNLLERQDWLGQGDGFSYTKCITLPRGDKFSIDKDLSQRYPSRYSVAIFSGVDRKPFDPIERRTLPYLKELVSAGVLKKHDAFIPSTNRMKSDELVAADIYELTDSYSDKLDPESPSCFSLGKPTMEFVDVQVKELNEYGYPFSSFKFKIRLRFENAPDWMKNPELKRDWPELGNVLDNGKACEANYAFDRKKRTNGTGAGSCWWAFESAEDAW